MMAIVATTSSNPLLNAIKELAEYLNEDPIITAFNVGNSFYVAREEWRKREPSTPSEIINYYRETKTLLHQLVFANYGIPHELDLIRHAGEIFDGCDSVLDIGAGIGSFLLNVKCRLKYHADVGGELFAYALRRYQNASHHNVSMIQLPDDYLQKDTIGLDFDGVICTEVIEHVPDPVAFVAYLSRLVKPGGKLLATVSFDDGDGMVPQHLNVGVWTNGKFTKTVFPAHGFDPLGNDVYLKCPSYDSRDWHFCRRGHHR